MLAISSAAPTPLPDTSPTSSAMSSVGQREVVEEVAADFPRRDRHALDLRQPESEGALRQHVVLDLTAELELAPDPFLLDRGALVPLDVLGHLVERRGQPADFVVRPDLDARAVVAVRDAVDAVAERRQIAREPRGQRHDADEREADATPGRAPALRAPAGAGSAANRRPGARCRTSDPSPWDRPSSRRSSHATLVVPAGASALVTVPPIASSFFVSSSVCV